MLQTLTAVAPSPGRIHTPDQATSVVRPTTRGESGPMPTITRERTRPGLRLVEASDFPAAILVSRLHDAAQVVIVVVSNEVPTAKIRGLARLVLRDGERQQLSRFLDGRRR